MIRLSRSVVGDAERAAIGRVLDSTYLGSGPETQRFEQELAAWFGGEVEVACVNTGTAALQLALQAAGLGAGDEVLVPSMTYVASFQAISATGALPVACEVREADALLDLEDAARRVTPRTRAVMPVHYASYAGDLGAIYDFARHHKLRVIEDAAHAFGCTDNGRKIGSFGDVACFSFDGIKNITSGEGGAVVSSDRAIIKRVQDLRLLGVERDTERRYNRERSWDFEVSEQGWRYHMSDIMAAIGRTQLGRFESEFKPKRMALARFYRQQLAALPQVRMFETDLDTVVPHILPVRIIGGMRDKVRAALQDQGIETGIHYKPNHLLARFGGGSPVLPVTERLYQELVSLPLHAALGDAEVTQIVAAVRAALV
jgi:dTDP-4-amino-4,6-dideoxygalactose transaminase